MIQARGVVNSYRLGAVSIDALRGVDIDVEKGEMMAITGVSGSGKSTLVQHLNGLLRPTEGIVTILGDDAAPLRPAALANMDVEAALVEALWGLC